MNHDESKLTIFKVIQKVKIPTKQKKIILEMRKAK
jgi:hypothetical protein